MHDLTAIKQLNAAYAERESYKARTAKRDQRNAAADYAAMIEDDATDKLQPIDRETIADLIIDPAYTHSGWYAADLRYGNELTPGDWQIIALMLRTLYE